MLSARSAVTATLLALIGVPVTAQVTFVPDPTPRITVTGTGAAMAQPDMATVSLGVYVLDRDLRKGKSSSDVILKRLLQLTQTLGIAPDDVSSSVLNIGPEYSEAKPPEFLGYEVSRSVTVTLRDLSKLDQLVDQAIEAGANREFNVSLTSSREQQLRQEAMTLAIDDAKAQAARLASGFGARLGPVRLINPGSGQAVRAAASAAFITYGHGTFAPGTIQFQADVSVTFLLEP
jgi:uncharacterized protein YggE